MMGVDNRENRDLRRHRAHYDVIVMFTATQAPICLTFGAAVTNMDECIYEYIKNIKRTKTKQIMTLCILHGAYYKYEHATS